jgi:hypothetical protein
MRTAGIVFLGEAVLLSFTACDDGGTTTPLPPPGYTPAQVLRSLIYAFNSRDIETLDGALAEDFTFYFDPKDVGTVIGDYTIPPIWGRDEHLTACGNMYDLAFDIDFVISTEFVAEPDEDATEFMAGDVYVQLLVMVDAQSGYIASGSCDFRFANEGADGTDNWVVTDWWDKTAAGGMYESATPASLGNILAIFR